MTDFPEGNDDLVNIDDDDDEVDPEFPFVCAKCGSQARVDNSLGCGSSWTGMWGDIEVVCINEDCSNRVSVYTP